VPQQQQPEAGSYCWFADVVVVHSLFVERWRWMAAAARRTTGGAAAAAA
jgi:hypothetical protein